MPVDHARQGLERFRGGKSVILDLYNKRTLVNLFANLHRQRYKIRTIYFFKGYFAANNDLNKSLPNQMMTTKSLRH